MRNLTNNGVSRQDLLVDISSGSSVENDLSEEDRVMNPFSDGSGPDEGVEGATDSMPKRGLSAASLAPDNFSKSDYKGYYSNRGSDVKVPQEQPQMNNVSKYPVNPASNFSASDILKPPEYDRYPQVSSRVTSVVPGQQQQQQQQRQQNSPNGSHSSLSSNPFLSEPDFSPFGGYPASSFPLLMEEKEDDDYLHNPDPEEEARLDRRRFVEDFKHMSKRSFGGWVGLLVLLMGGAAVFIVIPAVTFTGVTNHDTYHNVVTLLTNYEYPQLSAIRTNLVDDDTPDEYKTKEAKDGSLWKLVFSDEFNAEGRTFYDGEDQFWTAVNLNYGATKDLEWYDPDSVITSEGTLKLRMDAYENHNLFYRSAMLQSWNKMCFTQGRVEASVNLPNYARVSGLWPGMWTMGNLGRAGYLASTDGVWPYSYEACDAGITPNQSSTDGISYLPGQRLSICTCDGEEHPNQGTGRGAPEIDMIEAEADTTLMTGIASQSLQVAPFDIWYIPDYEFVEIYNFTTTSMNTYCGGPYQQAVSAITTLNPEWYEFGSASGGYQSYGFELLNDDDDGYIRWFVGETATMTLYAKALHPNGNIGWRRLSKEPMSIILNLGISNNWAYIDWQMIFFPVTMSIDYVRVYQPNDSVSITCDPTDYPTQAYIGAHENAYYDINATSWEDAGYTIPKNILTGNCKSSKYKNSSSS